MRPALGDRIVLSGELVALSPIHVGSGKPEPESDLPLICDGSGRLYLPGTSLTGALRAWSETAFGEALAARVFGYQESSNGQASRLVVDDAHLVGAESVPIDIRDHVSIDRGLGIASPGRRYDRAVLPKGTRFKMDMALDVPAAGPCGEDGVFGHLVEALAAGEIRLGASKSRGLGTVRLLEGYRLRQYSLGNRAGILAYLARNEHSGQLSNDISSGDLTNAAGRPRIHAGLGVEIRWRPLTPVLVKADRDGLCLDVVPLTGHVLSQIGNGQNLAHRAPLLPGSSIAGALRSHAERIVRTVLQMEEPIAADQRKPDFEQQINVPLVKDLFGMAARHKGAAQTRRSAMRVADCAATLLLSPDEWDGLADADKLEDQATVLKKLRARSKHVDIRPAIHVAIDRWTGGAAEGLLFGVLEPTDLPWGPITLDLDLDWVPRDYQLAATALLMLVLDDLKRGEISFGYGGNRGHGEIAIDGLEFHTRGIDPTDDQLGPLASLKSLTFDHPGGLIESLDEPVAQHLRTAWSRWLDDRRSEMLA